MARYVFIQALFFIMPFVLFAFWRLATKDVRGTKKAWPINMLFVAGIALGIVGWIVIISLTPKPEREVCTIPAQMVDGELVPAREVPCDDIRVVDREASGQGSARGFTDDGEGSLKTIQDIREHPEDPNPDPDLIDLDRNDDPENEGDGR